MLRTVENQKRWTSSILFEAAKNLGRGIQNLAFCLIFARFWIS
ncbi:hypothetical protein [Acidianus infernus]